jgi:ketosteroid isomerase-like protein
LSDQQNVELIKSAYAAFARGVQQTFLSLFSDHIEFQHPMPHSIWPWAGHRRGRNDLAQFFEGLAQTVEFELFEPREFIAQSDKVIVLLFERFSIRATGIAVDNDYVQVFTIKNGKVVQFLVFEDTAPIIAAIQSSPKLAS